MPGVQSSMPLKHDPTVDLITAKPNKQKSISAGKVKEEGKKRKLDHSDWRCWLWLQLWEQGWVEWGSTYAVHVYPLPKWSNMSRGVGRQTLASDFVLLGIHPSDLFRTDRKCVPAASVQIMPQIWFSFYATVKRFMLSIQPFHGLTYRNTNKNPVAVLSVHIYYLLFYQTGVHGSIPRNTCTPQRRLSEKRMW